MRIDNPRVNVLLAAYNGEEWIKEQIDSILAQKGVRVHIYISVDKSTDDTPAICEGFASNNDCITVLPYGEKYGSAGANFYRLIKAVKCNPYEYYAYSDQDDIWFPDKLSHACSTMERLRCNAFSSDVIAFWPTGRKKKITKSQPQVKYDHIFEAAGPGCTYVLDCDSFGLVQSYVSEDLYNCNSIVLHDWLTYSICRANGLTWHISSVPGLLYRQHSSNQVGASVGWTAFLRRFRLTKSGWYWREAQKVVRVTNQIELIDFFQQVHPILNLHLIRRSWRDRVKFVMAWLFYAPR